MWYKESQANIPIPSDKEPTRNTPYVYETYLENRQGSSRKYYQIRIYDYGDGTYSVIAYNARIGYRPRAQPKGMYRSLAAATSTASSLKRVKENEGYRDQSEYRRHEHNIDVGVPADAPVDPVNPTAPTPAQAPRDAVFSQRDVASASPQQLRDAIFNSAVSTNLKVMIAHSSKLTTSMLREIIFADSDAVDNSVRMKAITNVNSTSELLDEVIRSFYNGTESREAIKSPRVDRRTIDWILGRKLNDRLSQLAIGHPNAPWLSKTEWIANYGREDHNEEDMVSDAHTYLFGHESIPLKDITIQPSVEDIKRVGNIISLFGDDTLYSNSLSGMLEDIVDKAFENSESANYYLRIFEDRFFNSLPMKPEHRAMVEAYHQGDNEQSEEGELFDDIFAQNNSWYKRAKRK